MIGRAYNPNQEKIVPEDEVKLHPLAALKILSWKSLRGSKKKWEKQLANLDHKLEPTRHTPYLMRLAYLSVKWSLPQKVLPSPGTWW